MITNDTIRNFFKERGVEYLAEIAYIDKKTERAVQKKCARARFERERKWLGSYFGKEIDGKLYPPFEIRWISREIGYGVFAGANLQQNTFVAEYTGIIRRKKLFFHKSSNYCFGYETHMGYRGFVIDAEKAGNLARFVNHSEVPNVETLGVFRNGLLRIILRTTKAVRKGEQLTYDYGIDYWKKRSDKISNMSFDAIPLFL